MQHIAIMKKCWGLIPKILSGKKIVESRWYVSRRAPWDRIKVGETVYFKDSGAAVTARAEVAKVLQFADLTPPKIKAILREHGEAIGIEKDRIANEFKSVKDKKYCMLIWLKNPREIEPFNINKAGFGLMSAWLAVEDVERIKIKV